MAIEIKLPDGLIGILKKGFGNWLQKTETEISDTKSKLNTLLIRRDDLKDVLSQIETGKKIASKVKVADTAEEYNTLWKWSVKVKYIMSLTKKPITVADIIQYINYKEPEYRNDETKKKTLAQTVSRELSKHKQNIDYYLAGTNKPNKSLYGLLEWKNKE